MEIIIIGAGKLGAGLANRLSDEEHNVTVIDINNARITKLVETYDVQGVLGSGTHIDVLTEAGAETADLVIATTLSDENNILACLIAKKLGTRHTIARVRNPEYNMQYDFMKRELGLSLMINPDFAAAREISRILQFPYAVNIESFANGIIDMAEFKISDDSPLAGCKVSDASAKYKRRMLICAVERNEDVFIPNGDFVVKAGDRIHITGEHKDLASITKVLIGMKEVHPLKNIMLIGASRASIYLAQMLTQIGKNIIIVDNNRDKCKSIYDLVPRATVINGDASDHDLLAENGVSNMDAVVTLTNTDEVNFLVSLYAKKLGVRKTVTKINNYNFQRMLDELELGSRVNISEISVDTITQYVRAKKNVSSSYMKTLYKLVNGKVETIEFIAGEQTLFLDKPLAEIKLKKNVLVAAINRRNKTIFPNGNDSIKMNDIVIIVSKERKINSLNDIFDRE